MWLAWCAWGVIGSIFLFEDSAGGTGWLTLILTAPFWMMFVLWPLLWAWLRLRKDPELVEMDDDFPAGDGLVRVVQKDGIRYAECASLTAAFGDQALQGAKLQKIAGGDEDFVRLQDLPGSRSNQRLSDWLKQAAGPAAGKCAT